MAEGRDIKKQIERWMVAQGFNRRSLALSAGMNHTAVRDILSGKTSNPRSDTVDRLAAALGIDTVTLLTSLPEDAGIMRVGLDKEAPDESALVPVYDVQASAGHGAFVEYEAQAYGLAFPPDYLGKLTRSSPKNLAIISVKGESMEPTLLDDDIVLLDMSKLSLGFDGLFVLSFDETLHVKRVGRSARPGHITIISDHPKYPAIERAISDTKVVGKVLWYGRKV